ncbi:hypothetical protein SLEP1_g16046 [Rubroshorea leprosula]|uniref:Uncharacterized protein n=1 Tax=Rubroshorea leprosula TaxID=152421 RepID=A0AAV5IYS7_9ROSI|nr:hypothetical protein SLEP1_g16046 [Rubroshorea leprosula]
MMWTMEHQIDVLVRSSHLEQVLKDFVLKESLRRPS